MEPKPTFSFDLHVLGTPPAFVLSQDQTLRMLCFSEEADIAVFILEEETLTPQVQTIMRLSRT